MMTRLVSSNPTSAFQESVPPPALADRYVGIRVLWLKVIIRAVFDWVSYRDSNKLQQKKLADNAYSWLFLENRLFNGLENVCGLLDLSSERVRIWANSMSKDQVTKMEHLERDHVVSNMALLRFTHDVLQDESNEDC